MITNKEGLGTALFNREDVLMIPWLLWGMWERWGRSGWYVATKGIMYSTVFLFGCSSFSLWQLVALFIYDCTSSPLCPRSTRYLLSSAAWHTCRWSQDLEQILRILRAWPRAMPFLQWYGWQLSWWRYWWVSVSLVWRSVTTVESNKTLMYCIVPRPVFEQVLTVHVQRTERR